MAPQRVILFSSEHYSFHDTFSVTARLVFALLQWIVFLNIYVIIPMKDKGYKALVKNIAELIVVET